MLTEQRIPLLQRERAEALIHLSIVVYGTEVVGLVQVVDEALTLMFEVAHVGDVQCASICVTFILPH